MLVGIDVYAMVFVFQCPPDPLADDMLLLPRSIRSLVPPFPLNPHTTVWDRTIRLGFTVRARRAWEYPRWSHTADLGDVDWGHLMRDGSRRHRRSWAWWGYKKPSRRVRCGFILRVASKLE